ncbi:hypothetical protein PAPYR_11459 [Paratrimastix pyriformis]|uniref:Uncharacterized protein n=1 Tax=Paratrimastix pyriformis TaxID=342808 RepID=A0ABQ8U3Q0_9EUKA|nr:hypothetical protein PAPYR_11459 [Paratrimastix pyriformis]
MQTRSAIRTTAKPKAAAKPRAAKAPAKAPAKAKAPVKPRAPAKPKASAKPKTPAKPRAISRPKPVEEAKEAPVEAAAVPEPLTTPNKAALLYNHYEYMLRTGERYFTTRWRTDQARLNGRQAYLRAVRLYTDAKRSVMRQPARSYQFTDADRREMSAAVRGVRITEGMTAHDVRSARGKALSAARQRILSQRPKVTPETVGVRGNDSIDDPPSRVANSGTGFRLTVNMSEPLRAKLGAPSRAKKSR